MTKKASVAEMRCFRGCSSEINLFSKQKNPKTKNIRQEILLQIPGCTVHLMDEGEALELAKGEFIIIRILDKSVRVATIIKVGDDLQWPLTKDEPVVKLDSLHYLFSLPMKDGDHLSYGVTFLEQYSSRLTSLDSFLSEHSCFSAPTSTRGRNIEWEQFAPRVLDYNNVLARAIAQGTGQIIKGIFICSDSYSSQVCNGGEMILSHATEEKNAVTTSNFNRTKSSDAATNESEVNKSLKRVRSLSKMTENLSKAVLDVVGVATGSVIAPLVNSQAGKAFLATIPGEVLLASLDAVNKILDAAEVAEKQALSATATATTEMVTNRFGESAGEATEDVLATAGNCASTAWNIVKIRRAINPASSVSAGILRNAGKKNK